MSDLYTFTAYQLEAIHEVETLRKLRQVSHGYRDDSVRKVAQSATHTITESF